MIVINSTVVSSNWSKSSCVASLFENAEWERGREKERSFFSIWCCQTRLSIQQTTMVYRQQKSIHRITERWSHFSPSPRGGAPQIAALHWSGICCHLIRQNSSIFILFIYLWARLPFVTLLFTLIITTKFFSVLSVECHTDFSTLRLHQQMLKFRSSATWPKKKMREGPAMPAWQL